MRILTHPTLLATLLNLAIIAVMAFAIWITREIYALGALLLLQSVPVFNPDPPDDDDDDDDHEPRIGFSANID